MQSKVLSSARIPVVTQSYQYSLVVDVLFSWLRFFKASNEPHTQLDKRTFFHQRVLDVHHLADQIPDFKEALLAKRTQLVVGKLSFLLYSAFKGQKVDQSDINQWLQLGEVEEAAECLGFWLSYYLASGQCTQLPAQLWSSEHVWIRKGVIIALSNLRALSDDWVNIALADASDEVKDALYKGAVDSACGEKLLSRNHRPAKCSFEWLRFKVLYKQALTRDEQTELQQHTSSNQDALLLFLMQLPSQARITWLLENQQSLPYQSFVLAIGQIGEVSAVSSLLHAMANSEKYHRVSAQAFAAITGFDLTISDHLASEWEGEPDPDYGKNDQRKDNIYPWVNVSVLTSWWQENERNFRAEQSYLLGRPLRYVTSQTDYPASQPFFILNRIRYERYLVSPTPIYEWHSYRGSESL